MEIIISRLIFFQPLAERLKLDNGKIQYITFFPNPLEKEDKHVDEDGWPLYSAIYLYYSDE